MQWQNWKLYCQTAKRQRGEDNNCDPWTIWGLWRSATFEGWKIACLALIRTIYSDFIIFWKSNIEKRWLSCMSHLSLVCSGRLELLAVSLSAIRALSNSIYVSKLLYLFQPWSKLTEYTRWIIDDIMNSGVSSFCPTSNWTHRHSALGILFLYLVFPDSLSRHPCLGPVQY